MRDGMVIAKTYLNETEARLDASRLEALGLESWVETDNADGMYPQLDLMFGVKLMVAQEDAAAARDLLNPQAASVVDRPWDCPGCGERIEAGFDTCWNCGVTYAP
jgi:hypothetical protein